MLGIGYGEVRLPDKRPQAGLCSSICMRVYADQRRHRHLGAQTNPKYTAYANTLI